MTEENRSDRADGEPGQKRRAEREHLTGVGLEHWGDDFPSTHWSIILAENAGEETATRRMLERLCHHYWYPLYAYLRKRGHRSHDAQDLTQGFFSKMLSGDGLAGADQSRGRFRSYMIGAMNHYISGERRKSAAEKRGGGKVVLSIEEELAEQRFQNEPVSELSPEKLFDREWAIALLQDVHERLEEDYKRRGKDTEFKVLSQFLTMKPDKGTYPGLAAELGISEGNIRVKVNRIRKRYQDMLRSVIGETVDNEEEVETELRYLLTSVAVGG